MSQPKVYHRQTPHPPAIDEDSSILFLSVDRIRPNRAQPRNRFDTNTMIRLADSVRRYGILQPLTVRLPKTESKDPNLIPAQPLMYELIAGERRLRAAKLAGLTHVPCILASADDHLSAELAVIENLLREDLNMFEQARAFGRLILQFSLTQEQVARKMSMSQSAVANKLRLLRLRDTEQKAILEGGLTERHARALLRLPPDEQREKTIRRIIDLHMNVAATEEYIESLLSDSKNRKGHETMLAETTKSPKSGAVQQNNCTDITSDQIPNLSPVANQLTESEPSTHVDCNIPKTVLQDVNFENSGKKKLILKDLRIFYNSLERAVTILKQTGLSPQIERQETGSRLQITISVDNPSCDCSDGLQLAENSEGGLKQEPQEII